MKKIMIFGCNGFVGTSLCLTAKRQGWEVWGSDISNQPVMTDIHYMPCDITNRDTVLNAVALAKPDYTVNVAAIANIDFAEANREKAYQINVKGAENIALASSYVSARTLFFSSDAVFDGNNDIYTEFSSKAYVNYYGQTKGEAEELVRKSNPNSVVIRISLVLGFSPAKGNSFLDSMSAKFERGEKLECSETEIRTPIDISTLCSCVLELYDTDYRGVIHLGSTNSASRYEITSYAAELMGYPKNLVLAKKNDDPDKAPRHRNGIISVDLAQKLLKTPLYDYRTTIERAIDSKNNF